MKSLGIITVCSQDVRPMKFVGSTLFIASRFCIKFISHGKLRSDKSFNQTAGGHSGYDTSTYNT
jgi:hypothetical protein